MYRYTYLWLGFSFLVVWLILFFWRKDVRKEMLIMSGIFAFPGFLADLAYARDWWKPLTITETTLGVEGPLVGFAIGGIASVLYLEVFSKRLRAKRTKDDFSLYGLLGLVMVLFLGMFFLLGINSFLTTIVSLGLPTLFIWQRRKDLIVNSLLSGILLLLVAVLVYTLVELLTPGWVQSFWYFQNVPNIVILNVPLDDIVWYLLAGMFIGPLYEWWKGKKTIRNTT